MTPDRFTVKMQEALATSQGIVARYGHPELKPSHVFLALLDQEGGIARPLFEKLGTNLPALKAAVESYLARQPKVSGASGQPHPSSDLRETFVNAEKEQSKLKDDYLSVEHFLLGLLKTRTDIESVLKSGHYSTLPTPQTTVDRTGLPGRTTLTITNQTQYSLNISSSGPTAGRYTISAGDTQDIEVSPGSYRIVGRVSAPNVLPFYGAQAYTSGTKYSYRFYIK